MGSYDGSAEPLMYGHALAMMVDKCAWGSEALAAEVKEAVLREHGLYVEPPKPDDPHAALMHETNKELAELRALAAKLQAEKDQREQADEIAKLRAQIAGHESGQDAVVQTTGDDATVTTEDYSEMTVAMLRSRLLARELPVGGNKDELIARLEEADQLVNA